MIDKKKLFKSVLFFISFSFIGWVLEEIVQLIMGTTDHLSLMQVLTGLNLPFLPIYGFGALLLLRLSKIQKNLKFNFFTRVITSAFILTLFELISGLFTTYVFNIRFWDYSQHTFNIDGHISFIVFIFWVLMSLLFEAIETLEVL